MARAVPTAKELGGRARQSPSSPRLAFRRADRQTDQHHRNTIQSAM